MCRFLIGLSVPRGEAHLAPVEGVLASVSPVGMQFVVARPSVRSGRFQDRVKARPTLPLHRGRFPSDAPRAERVTREEVLAVPHSDGVEDPADVAAGVPETGGSFGVLRSGPDAATLRDVAAADSAARG